MDLWGCLLASERRMEGSRAVCVLLVRETS